MTTTTETTKTTASLRMWQASQAAAEKAVATYKRQIATQQAALKDTEEGLAYINKCIREIMDRKDKSK